jgi:hypothetical protein
MGVREVVRDWLAGDAALMALLTGGLWTAPEITRQYAPGAFDANGEIQPCGLVHLESAGPTLEYEMGERGFVTVAFYQQRGYDVIDAALAEVYVRLHLSKAGTAGAALSIFEIRWADDSAEMEDQGLACSLRFARYQVIRMRGEEA